MTSNLRRMVGLVLIAVCCQGRLTAQNRFCGLEEAGKFTLDLDFHAERDAPDASPAERRRIEAKLAALAALIQGSQVMNPPRGFAVEAFVTYDLPPTNHPRLAHVAWLTATLEFGTYPCLVLPNGDLAHGPEGFEQVDIYVNSVPWLRYGTPGDLNKWVLPDGREIMWMPPATSLRVSGSTVHVEGVDAPETFLVLTKGDVLPWVPVSREQFLSVLIQQRERQSAKYPKEEPACGAAYRNWLAQRNERLKLQEKIYQDRKATDPAGAEKYRADMAKIETEVGAGLQADQARCEAARPRQPPQPSFDERFIAPLRAELAAMTPAERASQAWYTRGPLRANYESSRLVPAETPEARPLWAVNPDFFGPSRPRTDFRVISVEIARTGTWDGHGGYDPPKKAEPSDDTDTRHRWRMYEFLTTTDWQRVAQLLD